MKTPNRTDVFTTQKRSAVMRSVKSTNTTPERIIRKALFARGFRFRLHRCDLPGSPDIVLPKFNAVIFVHGCFWHGHDCRRGARIPKSNTEYWCAKIARNKARDATNVAQLQAMGYRIRTIWECDVKDPETINNCALWLTHEIDRQTDQ